MITLSKWYRLDNAAKIFPPSKNKYDAKIFRFSVSLKENVDKNILEQGNTIGSISEIYDSVLPTKGKGAFAQAWSVAEVFRILLDKQEDIKWEY